LRFCKRVVREEIPWKGEKGRAACLFEKRWGQGQNEKGKLRWKLLEENSVLRLKGKSWSGKGREKGDVRCHRRGVSEGLRKLSEGSTHLPAAWVGKEPVGGEKKRVTFGVALQEMKNHAKEKAASERHCREKKKKGSDHTPGSRRRMRIERQTEKKEKAPRREDQSQEKKNDEIAIS